MSIGQIVFGIFANLCPSCSRGKVLTGILAMNKTCPSCGASFEREAGYYTGAMALNYIIGFLIILPTILFLMWLDVSLPVLVLIPAGELVVFAPLIVRFSRLLWLYLDYRLQPK